MQSHSRTDACDDDWNSIFDRYDQLVRDCVGGHISFESFQVEYDNFYMRYALDGHEATGKPERDELERLEDRIAPHREIWDSILSAGLSLEYETDPETYRKHGFFGNEEAFERMLELVGKYPEMAGPLRRN